MNELSHTRILFWGYLLEMKVHREDTLQPFSDAIFQIFLGANHGGPSRNIKYYFSCTKFPKKISQTLFSALFSHLPRKEKNAGYNVWLLLRNDRWPNIGFKIFHHYSVKTRFRQTTRGEKFVAKHSCKTFSSGLMSSVFNILLLTSALMVLPSSGTDSATRADLESKTTKGVTKIKYFPARTPIVSSISADSSF